MTKDDAVKSYLLANDMLSSDHPTSRAYGRLFKTTAPAIQEWVTEQSEIDAEEGEAATMIQAWIAFAASVAAQILYHHVGDNKVAQACTLTICSKDFNARLISQLSGLSKERG